MTRPPPRLYDDPSAPEDLVRDLSHARHARARHYDAEAGLVRLRSAIVVLGPGGQAEPGSGAVDAATSATQGVVAGNIGGATVGASMAAKWSLGMLALVGAVGAGVVLSPAPKSPERPEASTAAPAKPAVTTEAVAPVVPAMPRDPDPRARAPAERPETTTVDVPGEPASSRVDATPKTPKRSVRRAANVARKRTDADTASIRNEEARERPDDAMRREIDLLSETRRALAANPTRALALAERGQREFATGMFRQEREAIAIIALGRLARHAAAVRRGTAFLVRYPNGTFADRIRLVLEAAPATDEGSGGPRPSRDVGSATPEQEKRP